MSTTTPHPLTLAAAAMAGVAVGGVLATSWIVVHRRKVSSTSDSSSPDDEAIVAAQTEEEEEREDDWVDRLIDTLRQVPEDKWEGVSRHLNRFLEEVKREIVGGGDPPHQAEPQMAEQQRPVVIMDANCNNSSSEENVNGTTRETTDDVEGFRKMLKVGLPLEVVQHKMRMEKLDPELLNDVVAAPKPPPPPVAEVDENVKRFVMMLKVGIPREAVELKMRNEGFDPSTLPILETVTPPPPGSVSSSHAAAPQPPTPAPAPPVVKLFVAVETLPDERAKSSSIWNDISGDARDSSSAGNSSEEEEPSILSPTVTRRLMEVFVTGKQNDDEDNECRDEHNHPHNDDKENRGVRHGNLRPSNTPRKPLNNHNNNKTPSKAIVSSNTIPLLPARRAQNVAIALARFSRMSPREICLAIEQIRVAVGENEVKDETTLPPLTEDHLELLNKILPTREEIALVMTAAPETSGGEAERFFRLLATTVPDAGERVEAMTSVLKMGPACADLERRVVAVRSACEEVKASGETLRRVLRAALKVCNFLNVSYARRGAEEGSEKPHDTAREKVTPKRLRAVSLVGLAEKLSNAHSLDHGSSAMDAVVEVLTAPSKAGRGGDNPLLTTREELRALCLRLKPRLEAAGNSPTASLTVMRREAEELVSSERRCHAVFSRNGKTMPRLSHEPREIAESVREVNEILYPGMLTYFGERFDLPSPVFFSSLRNLLLAVERCLGK